MSATILFLILACVVILVAWIVNPKWRSAIKGFSPAFSLVANIATLSVFVQFYQAYEQSVQDTAEKRREDRASFNARMSALSTEVLSNISTCNLFKAEATEYLSGHTVPGIRFSYIVEDAMIRNGDITHHKLRAEIISLMSQMQSINTVIEENMSIMIMKASVDASRHEAIRKRIVSSMVGFIKQVESIRSQLSATQPLIDEFWKDPNKFRDEEYLRDRMIPDGLIR